MTPEEALLGITRYGAAALSREGRVGSLAPGARADLLVLETRSYVDMAYHYGVNLARAVVTGRAPRGN
jgi:imidazolonepropionase